MSEQTAVQPRYSVSQRDRQVLRELAKQVADLAARPVEAEKRELWYRHNALEPTRPLVFCDPENGWNEILTPDKLQCEGGLARGWEWHLRRELFWGEQMRDDKVIEPYFNVGHVYTETDWGLRETRIGGEGGGAWRWEAPLRSYDDMDKLRFPQIRVDYEATEELLQLAQETLGDILHVRLKTTWWWSFGMTQTLVYLRGLEQIMYDMVDCPDNVHRLMAFLRDGHAARIDFLEKNGLLYLNNDGSYVGSGGFGWTHELPQPDFYGHVRTIDMWGFAESQETVGISPEMFEEFIFPYQLSLLERFGLNCYGCCEPLDSRWHVVERFPRLRRVSMSPWVNVEVMAERLGNRYIFSWKPHPGVLAADTFDEDFVRQTLRRGLRALRKNDCRVEMIMKDCHTIRHDPQRVIRWVQIAKEEAEAW
ncbi:MAG: hypothetical protein KatS3mg023_1337 [Armatimonadota bacterium]|nr:MAG: hypothetical protein KatS3mg023_1337 [Armatimonadota bacterium]